MTTTYSTAPHPRPPGFPDGDRRNRERVAAELAEARAGRAPTLFDTLTEIFTDHGPHTLRLR
ncbi:hypothetical protein [Streptomyces sp. NPDC058279]|uniref:hypothetical protein n=1 Tax=Streptomyces sp. NPDC058279 TaxID=3346418 RepID=UPI0036EE35F6